jgi:DNA-binding MarR family transcriptional regulator
MPAQNDAAFDEVVRIWSTWWSRAPTALARQEPSMVARLLNLGLRKEGISQSDLRRELGMNQPRLSKLMKKLVRTGWIRIRRSKTDNRVKLMTTTAPARDRIATMKSDLAAVLRAEVAKLAAAPSRKPKLSAVRRRIEKQQQPPGFDFEKYE